MFSVDIIVPVYNAALTLDRCVTSLMSQTYKNFRIILVNDGSTDSSGDICEKYAAKDSRIIAIHKPNGGANSARNVALDVAKGNYVTFVDSDDELDSETLKLNMDILNSNQDIDMLQFPICEVSSSGYKNVIHKATILHGSRDVFLNWYDEDSLLEGYLCGKIFKRELFQGLILPEDMILTEDAYNIAALSSKTQCCYISEKGVYLYHIFDTSASHSNSSPKKYFDVLTTRLKHYEKLCSLPETEEQQVKYFLKIVREYINVKISSRNSYLINKELNYMRTMEPSLIEVIKYMPRSNKDRLWWVFIKLFGLRLFCSLYVWVILYKSK